MNIEQEMKDLHLIYMNGLLQADEEMNRRIDHMVEAMRGFVECYDSKKILEDKIDSLEEKISPDCGCGCGDEECI